VVHLVRGTELGEGALQRLRGADVARTRGGRENQHPAEHRRIVAGGDGAVKQPKVPGATDGARV